MTMHFLFPVVMVCSSVWLWSVGGFLLLAGMAGASRGPLSVPETSQNGDSSVPLHSQNVHVSNTSTSGGCREDCDCHVEGRCKPCSRFEMGRQVHECLRTGYRQWAYCTQEKTKKYVSCHYHTEPGEQRAFWLFQVAVLVMGAASYVVVQWRQTRMERMVAYRIEQQIRA